MTRLLTLPPEQVRLVWDAPRQYYRVDYQRFPDEAWIVLVYTGSYRDAEQSVRVLTGKLTGKSNAL